jgi:hypothetical protein
MWFIEKVQAGDMKKKTFKVEHPFRKFEFTAVSIEDKTDWIAALTLAMQEDIHSLDIIQESALMKEIVPVRQLLCSSKHLNRKKRMKSLFNNFLCI